MTVYPEYGPARVRGKVNVRWLLYHSDPRFYQPGDRFWTWDERYGGDKLLRHSVVSDAFYADDRPREGFCWYGRKESVHVEGGIDLRSLPLGDKDALAEVMRSSEYLYCPEMSLIETEAALCGCPVEKELDWSMEQAVAFRDVLVARHREDCERGMARVKAFADECLALL